MQLEILRSVTELERLKDEWNYLLQFSASHVPFLRNEYLTTWWHTLGGGEWRQAELYVICGRDEADLLRAIAPLFLTGNPEGEPVFMFLGSIEISDYLDFIVRPEDMAQFFSLMFKHLATDVAPGCKALDLYNILDCSPTLQSLKKSSEALGWNYQEERLQHSPYIALPGDWESYLLSIDKKQRHEIRRKIRRLEESGEIVRWYIVEDEAHLDREIEDFLNLMEQDPSKQAFLTDIMRSQIQATARTAFQHGWLQLVFLEIGGQKAAAYLNFDYDNHIWLYNSGWDNRFSSLSPGWVLLGYLLEWANRQKRAFFDFMRGDEDYKYRFGGIDRFVMRAIVHRP